MTQHPPIRRVLTVVPGLALCLVFAGAFIGAHAQDPPVITLSIGSPPGPIEEGDFADVPVISQAEGALPATILFFMEFDESKLAFIDVRLGDGVPDGKQVSRNIIRSDGSTITTLAMGLFGLDTNTVPNGPAFIVTFRVDNAGVDESVPLVAVDGSAVSPAGTSFTVLLEDGAIDLSCPPVDAPANVTASQGDTDGVLVSWNAVAGANEYRVFRGTTSNAAASAPVSPWQTETSFLDMTAPGPRTVQQPGCKGGAETVFTTVYYFVKSRVRVDCESPFSTGAAGFRGGDPAKSSDHIAPDEILRIPLSHEEGIDPRSIIVNVIGKTSTPAFFDWEESSDGNGEVIVYPHTQWPAGTVMTITIEALTLLGMPIDPVSADYSVEGAETLSEANWLAPFRGVDGGYLPLALVMIFLAGWGRVAASRRAMRN